jgi:DNA-binding protein HU-beta
LFSCVRKITRERCFSISDSIRSLLVRARRNVCLGGFRRAIKGSESMPSTVTKSDLVEVAAKAGNVSKSAAGEAVNAVFDAIVDSVAKGRRVTVIGFGTFLPRKRKARAGRSPANGKEIKIPAKTLPAFAAGQGFKEAVDKK